MAALDGVAEPPGKSAAAVREHWEYCCVFKVGSKEAQLDIDSANGESTTVEERRHFLQHTSKTIERIKYTGLTTKLLLNKAETLVFCLIGASEEVLCEKADKRDVDILINPEAAIAFGQVLNLPLAENTDPTMDIVEEMDTSWFGGYPSLAFPGKLPRDSWEHIYVKLDQAPDDQFMGIYQHYDRITNIACDPPAKRYSNKLHQTGPSELSRISLFDAKNRLRLIYEMLVSAPDEDGAWLQIEQMIESDVHPMIACYPLHAPDQLDVLGQTWGANDTGIASLFAVPNPDAISGVREYFSEEVGFMVAFLAFYTEWLKPPSVIAVLAQGLHVMSGSNLVVLLFSFIIIFWGQAFVDYWVRFQRNLCVKWGMTKYETKEVTRPQYIGELVTSSVTGEKVQRENKADSLKRTAVSITVFVAFILGMLAGVIGTLIVRKVFENDRCEVSVPIAMGCACLNSGLISLFGSWYSQIAPILNEYENHRTNVQHQEAEIFKTFVFQFCNNFSCLFYYAFVHRQILPSACYELVKEADIMYTVMVQLGTLFCINICAGNFMELYGHSMSMEVTEEELASMDCYEQDYYKEHYEDTVDDYTESIIQFGYVQLFVVAFPMALPVALLSNMFEMNVVDRPKLLYNIRRPVPWGASGIGGWVWCLEATSAMAVLTNVAMFVWNTTSVFEWYIASGVNDPYVKEMIGDPYKWIFFFTACTIILLIKAIIAAWIPNEPMQVVKHIMRQDHIEAELVDSRRIEDEEEESSTAGKRRTEFRFGTLGDEKLNQRRYPALDLTKVGPATGVGLHNFE